MSKIPLTRKQQDILAMIKKYKQDNNLAPTIEYLARAFSISGSTMYEHLLALETKGWIRKYKFYERSIEVINGD